MGSIDHRIHRIEPPARHVQRQSQLRTPCAPERLERFDTFDPTCNRPHWVRIAFEQEGPIQFRENDFERAQVADAVGWERGRTIRTEASSASQDATAILTQLQHLSWNGVIQGPIDPVTTSQLSRMLGTSWIGSDTVNLLVGRLNERLKACQDEGDHIDIIIASSDLSNTIKRISSIKKLKKRNVPGGLQHIEAQIKEAKTPVKLYMPLFVNENHWVAILIDFDNCTVSWGTMPLVILPSSHELTHVTRRLTWTPTASRILGLSSAMVA